MEIAIDPVAFSIFGLPIRWYGLAYVAGFICGLYYFQHLIKKWPTKNLTKEKTDDLFIWVVLGIILGGRFGYVLFYNLPYYLTDPIKSLFIWDGGMSFHGGFLGVVAATYLFCRKHKISWFDLGARIAPAACFGLFFGRMANFVNGELYGRVTEGPWGVIFPHGGPLPRHPSQLYEAALEGIVLFLTLHFIARTNPPQLRVTSFFFIFYGLFRAVVELVRQPDNIAHLSGGAYTLFTQGQLLSLPMILVGAFLFYLSTKHGRR